MKDEGVRKEGKKEKEGEEKERGRAPLIIHISGYATDAQNKRKLIELIELTYRNEMKCNEMR